MEFITLFFIVFWGWVNSYFAQKRGRNPYLWFFLGTFFGPFPLIALFLMPSFDPQEKVEETPAIIETEAIRVAPHSPYDWYYLDESRKQHGPHTIVELKKFWNEDQISKETYIWNETMTEWKKIKDNPELRETLEI